jgi:hypothetical protein
LNKLNGVNIVKKILVFVIIAINTIIGQTTGDSDKIVFPLNSTEDLELINVKAEVVDYMGKSGIEISKSDSEITGETLVIIPEINFENGIITIELTGEPSAEADPQMRGFVGIAFHVNQTDYSRYKCFYLRSTNARADNQLRRNHSTQYIAHPEYPWYRLRKEHTGLYESYVDLVPAEWTKIKIEVADKVAKLYVHDAEQPCLIINDLKHEESEGKIALWLHSSTLARYRNLVVTPQN